MEKISISEVKKRYDTGYRFVFSLELQDRTSEMYDHIIEDYRVFDSIYIAQNPDCMLFTNQYGERFSIDEISWVFIRSKSTDSVLLDIKCNTLSAGMKSWAILVDKIK